jgi:hypothetical protein
VNPEAKTRFDKAAAVLGLDEEARALAWRVLAICRCRRMTRR